MMDEANSFVLSTCVGEHLLTVTLRILGLTWPLLADIIPPAGMW